MPLDTKRNKRQSVGEVERERGREGEKEREARKWHALRIRGIKKKKGKEREKNRTIWEKDRVPGSLNRIHPWRWIAARSDYQRNLVPWGCFLPGVGRPTEFLNPFAAPGTCLDEKTWEGICRAVRDSLFSSPPLSSLLRLLLLALLFAALKNRSPPFLSLLN